MQYQHAIIGGTFDHFHVGHEAMLRKAFEVAERVSIGITTSELFQHKTLASSIQDFEIRKQAVEQFLEKNSWSDRATILPIQDKYGSTLTDPTIEAIIVSPETEPVARSIVSERVAKGLSAMNVILVPFVMADDNEPVSSQRIRQGLINRDGFSYHKFFKDKQTYNLPDALRPELQKPIGDIYQDPEEIKNKLSNMPQTITVGDIVTTTLLEAGIRPTLAFVDFRTLRHDLDQTTIDQHFSKIDKTISNPHGTINPEVANIILKNESYSRIIKVDGEEDLITLPAILLSPLESVVIYGQYEIGMVVVTITEEKKQLIKSLLEQF